MLIDWFTVIAQIVNFLILVWLLKRFLYKRILDAIAARENGIAAGLAEAEAKEKEAGRQLALYRENLSGIERAREEMLAQARADAESMRATMLDSARQQVRALDAQWKEVLDREREAFLVDLRRRAAGRILDIARRTVAGLAGVEVERCAAEMFLEKVRSLDGDCWKHIGHGAVSVRSTCELSAELRDRIRGAIGARVETPVTVTFERAEGIGLGLELRANGWQIGWNSESYLEALEDDLMRALEPGAERVPDEEGSVHERT